MYAAPGSQPRWVAPRSCPPAFIEPQQISVAALYCCNSSPYRRIPGVDVFDLARDARSFSGGVPVVAHPPCRSWGRLRHLAKPRPGERELAFHALASVRSCGGVLEHPFASSFWAAAELPRPGEAADSVGGFTIQIEQGWFGHRAPKATWLYVCGVSPAAFPPLPSRVRASHFVELMGRAERERTPVELAYWLVDLASRCRGRLPFTPTCNHGGEK